MSDIQAGDVVICVDARPGPIPNSLDLRHGCLYRVRRTSRGHSGKRILFLCEQRADDFTGFYPARFRKLNDEPDNAELIERIRKCRPMKIGEPALASRLTQGQPS
jgi:hypothetical protein